MKWLRNLGWPLSLLYGWVVCVRNALYDRGWLPSRAYDLPVLCVGNLSVGGSGKTPMVEWLLTQLLPQRRVAVLSRGYRRRTRGFLLVTPERTAAEVGDEPLQLARKFPEAIVAVDANRQRGLEILMAISSPDLILLDDAFQHRKVRPTRSILLTAFDELYPGEPYLPVGNLRDHRSQARRADLVVVTKCPEPLSEAERGRVRGLLDLDPAQQLAFAHLCYGEIRDRGGQPVDPEALGRQPITLVTGIAKPEPLLAYLEQLGLRFDHLKFRDHHNFTAAERGELKNRQPVLTTEKDATRLEGALDELWVLPVAHCFPPRDAAVMQRFLSQF